MTNNQPPRHRLRTLLILLACALAMTALVTAWFWGWSQYEGFVKRQKLTPIPVPTPP